MPKNYFKFKEFTVHQNGTAMKVTTDACLFGAWAAADLQNLQPARILDIGTGTGLLALMAAQACPAAQIDAVEIEAGAAQQALGNIHASPWAHHIRVQHTDILHAAFGSKFDAIICNPPFYENELASPDAGRNMAHHAGGLLLAELMPLIAANLKDTGHAYLLLPAKRKAEIPGLLQSAGLAVDRWITVKQTEKHAAFRILIRCGHIQGTKKAPDEQEIVIADADGNYTADFSTLLKEYYLYL